MRIGDSQPDGFWNQAFPQSMFGYSNQWGNNKKQVGFSAFTDASQHANTQDWGRNKGAYARGKGQYQAANSGSGVTVLTAR